MAFSDAMNSRVRKAFRLSLNEIGRRIRDDIRESISIRVERVGSEIIRSEPGEPPRREHGDLWRSIKYKVRAMATSLEALVVYTNDEKAPWLEYGTRSMEPRPFFEPARRRATGLKQLLKDLVAERLNGNADFPALDSAFQEE